MLYVWYLDSFNDAIEMIVGILEGQRLSEVCFFSPISFQFLIFFIL